MITYLAIDPGESGCIVSASVNDSHLASVEIYKMPSTPLDILQLLKDLAVREGTVKCWLENVGQYHSGNSGPSAAKFAKHVGHLEMALLAAGISHDKVTPQKWMGSFITTMPRVERQDPKKPTSSELNKERTLRKNAIKTRAQQVFPKISDKVVLWNSDGLGILYELLKSEGVKGI